jgi:NDP-sugar pyrophosphorylase family protein
MKGLILAAGLGTRLSPLTDELPKALIKIGNIPLIEFAVMKLIHYGFDEIIINVHHHADKIINFLNDNGNYNCQITVSDERDLLLDTGGAVKKASWFFSDGKPFLIYNCDIVTSLDLGKLYEYHLEKESLGTLAVLNRETDRCFLLDNNFQLCGWHNNKTGEKIVTAPDDRSLFPRAFSGIHVMNPILFQQFPEKNVFSLVEFYLRLTRESHINCYDHTGDKWSDIGKPASLEEFCSFTIDEYL